MKKILSILIIGVFAFLLLPWQPVAAESTQEIICNEVQKKVDPNCTSKNVNNLVSDVLNVMSFVLGAVAVLVLVIAGITMVFAGSNPDTAKKARQAILYAVVGLVVALLAQAIVRFILTRVG